MGFASALMLTNFGISAVTFDQSPDMNRPIFTAVTFLTVLGVGAFSAMLGGGRTSGGSFPGFVGISRGGIRDWPNAALPIDLGARALAEAVAGVGATAVWLAALAAFAPLASALGLDLGRFPGYLSRCAAAWPVIVSVPMLVPCAMAGLLPARSQAIGVLRGYATGAVAGFVTTFDSLPLSIVCAAAIAAALWATARVALVPGPFAWPSRVRWQGRLRGKLFGAQGGRRPRGSPAPLFRASRPPLAQFWRDACLGPLRLRVTRWTLVAAVACIGLAWVVSHASVSWNIAAAALVGMPPLWVGGMLAWCPLGTFPDGRRGSSGLLDDANSLAWLTLPLRREWVMRAHYLHGLVTGLVFVALTVLGARITGGLPLFPADVAAGWPGLLCGVPPLAGLLTCRAASDRARGAICLASLLLIWTGHIVADERIALAPLVLLALVGGVPPLVHLRDRRSRDAP